MKNRSFRWATILSVSALGLILSNTGQASAAGFPAPACRAGYIQAGTRLCIDQIPQQPTQFDTAVARCRARSGYVASYGDLYYLYVNTVFDANYNPNGRWLGPDLSGDDQALCGNRDITFNGDVDRENFEGTCNKNDSRTYWCAHDRE